MDIVTLRDTFLQLKEADIISFISSEKKVLKLLFINADPSTENSLLLSQIQIYLGEIQLSDNAARSEEIQFLYTELAFFFKRNNEMGPVFDCINLIEESVLKFRLKAWLHYKQYTNNDSHINLFRKYLLKLSAAITDGVEDYVNEVLRDLNVYFNSTTKTLTDLGESELINLFQSQFDDKEIQAEFPLLLLYALNKEQFADDIEINEIKTKIFEPSAFTAALFEDKFLSYIRNHPTTKWHHILLGYDNYTIRSTIIKYGQAEFDTPYDSLTTEDIVKLYSYFNMRKHYYSSMYAFDRLGLIQKYYGTSGSIKFIDIGCGPATSGIAFTDLIHSHTETTVSFDYFGIDYYSSMCAAAKNYMDNDVYIPGELTCYLKDLSDMNFDWLNNASCIVINTCYLFASGSLKEDILAENIVTLRKAVPETPFFVIFQNTTDKEKNHKYTTFKALIPGLSVLLSENAVINYNNRRNSYYTPTQETVFLEILALN